MLNVLCNDFKNSGRTEGSKEGRKEGRKDGRKKSHIEVAAPPKNCTVGVSRLTDQSCIELFAPGGEITVPTLQFNTLIP